MSRHHRRLDQRRWRAVRGAAIVAAAGRCQDCGRLGRLEVHHRTSLDDGGAPYDPRNLEVLCPTCHDLRHGHLDGGHRPKRRKRRPPSPAAAAWRRLVDELR